MTSVASVVYSTLTTIKYGTFLKLKTELTYHVILRRDTPCRGKLNLSAMRPFAVFNHSGELSKCNWPALSSCLYCSGVGRWGDPIFFQTSYELLCFASTR